jgi:hypothetical protein
VCWKPCSSCWSLHLLREEFLSAPIHSPLSGSPYRSFTLHGGARRGGLQAWWERRPGLQVLEVLIEASANIVEKAESVRLIVVRRPLSPRLGDCPSFYTPKREQFTCVPHYFPTCGGVASSATEPTAVLANPAPVEALWRVLCSYRSGFECGGVVVGRPAAATGRFEGVVNEGPVRGTVAVVAMSCPLHSNSIGMSSQCSAWRDSGGDGRTGLTATGKTAPAGLTSRRGPV